MRHTPENGENVGAYFSADQNQEAFKKFLQDKVDTYMAMRKNYAPHMDRLPLLSTTALLMVCELVFPMPPERNEVLSKARVESVKHAVTRSMEDRAFADTSIEPSSAEIAGLEMTHPHLPALIDILQQMNQLGLDEDVYQTAAGAVFYLAENDDFFDAE